MSYWISLIFLVALFPDQLSSQRGNPTGNPYVVPVFYAPNDQVEVITGDSVETLLDSNFLSVVKFYAHNDGDSWYFVPRYLKFANETQLWHSSVLRVIAIDCVDEVPATGRLCHSNGMTHVFPQFKFYKPFQKSEIGYYGLDARFQKVDYENSTDEDFLRMSIHFIEQQEPKPDNWPSLKAYQ